MCFYAGAVSFYVKLKNNQVLSLNEVVRWNGEFVDTDNAFSTSSGTFRAPVNGLYFFGVYFRCYKHKTLHLRITRKGSPNGSGFARSGTGSMMAIFNLKKGDKVQVRHASSTTETILGNYSRFVGFRL